MANPSSSMAVSKAPMQVNDVSKATGTWSSLFLHGNASKLKTTLNHFKPVVIDGVAEVPEAVIEKSSKEWEEYMVGFFIGKRLPYPLVKDVLQKQWKLQNFEMVADDDLFYFKFQSEDDKIMVIDKGPIFIAGRLFVLKFWSPEVDKGKNLISSVPIWVKFENVPKRLWSEEGLGFIASLLGRPVCLDDATLKKTRLKFAKVCIEVDLECPFPKSLKIKLGGEIVDIKVDYTWIPSKCSKCASFGHLSNKCTRKLSTTWQAVADIAGPSCIRNSQGIEVPASKIVERLSPPSSPSKVALQSSERSSPISPTNRFSCLQDIPDDIIEEDDKETSLVVYEAPVAEKDIENLQSNDLITNETLLLEQPVEGALVNEGIQIVVPEGAQSDRHSNVVAMREATVDCEISRVIEGVETAMLSNVVVGDEVGASHVNLTHEVDEEFSAQDVLESEPEILDKFEREKEMYQALVDYGENQEEVFDSDHDSEEEIEVFKDHIMKEPLPVVFENPTMFNDISEGEVSRNVEPIAESTKRPREAWNTPVYANSMQVLMIKQKILKKKLKVWAKQHCSLLHEKVQLALVQLESVQLQLHNSPTDVALCRMERQLLKKYCNLAAAEHNQIRQQSGCDWLTMGDRPTSYFHFAVKERRNRKAIRSLDDRMGNKLNTEIEIVREITSYYKEILGVADSEVDLDIIRELNFNQ
ncbi:Rna exonuclease, partial [Thalictrum thalictroides]